jgi:hypothetical protein
MNSQIEKEFRFMQFPLFSIDQRKERWTPTYFSSLSEQESDSLKSKCIEVCSELEPSAVKKSES